MMAWRHAGRSPGERRHDGFDRQKTQHSTPSGIGASHVSAIQQHRGGDLILRIVRKSRRKGRRQTEFDEPEPAGRDRHLRQQADERECGEDRGSRRLFRPGRPPALPIRFPEHDGSKSRSSQNPSRLSADARSNVYRAVTTLPPSPRGLLAARIG